MVVSERGKYIGVLFGPEAASQRSASFFDGLRTRKARSSWLPILVEILASAALFVTYYRYVNLPWLHEQVLAGVPVEQRAKAGRFLTVDFLTISAMISVVVTILLMTAVSGIPCAGGHRG